MSRQSLLPPRCPFQKPLVSRPIHDSYPQHHRSPSQGSILGEKPAWLDDLLSDEDADSSGTCLRRSASDSVTLLEGIVNSFSGFSPYNNEAASVGGETCSGLESASMYGPNSPRRRGNVTFSENAIASALSEYAFQNPLQYVDGSLCIWGNTPLESMGNACGSAGELNGETSTVKRQSGQRSRVRKLQYIAELERTVNVLQTLESDLAFKVASMLQKRAALSLENNTLKQQLARLRQEKLIVDAQHKTLKKEAERLKNKLGSSTNNKFRTYSRSSLSPEEARSEVTWQMARHNLN
ncbi:PREDICTED: basic leucine zipper 6-like isoform X1 [Populus euphratica]|uniref:Basic leucine zipper 6-like isoform X1 n=1 Tax=Populus euphratica TaxID=75702 RepID=A0AAJ6U722_POPEU|nr:PREDICTED: basic leucine zipper 6-like isoform X1 [Populus euphratica]XP_011024149.1 PREDICTED: basic leucine zipper 6-like isoform X1 [Populus euphratica]XP_011024150.1 PREDICTED: basic leucine zipper 6-like isoform X1 [Populus euphratica]XP_011024151.1 PREDICTED: basic leucine zipper 6-like isoform X2 [Populus euphratica]XP_011024152.1 PREDICTED: basic leucine zipper 6-like isoform X1 [Populus euphratica]